MKKIISFFLFAFVSIHLNAQDLHLTQFYTSNMSASPALLGKFTGDLKVVGNYRNQWRQVGSPINTTMISLEKNHQMFLDRFSYGLIIMDDRISDIGLSTTKVYLGGAYIKNVNDHLIRFGAQVGFGLNAVDFSGQTFPDQWNYQGGIFDESIGNGEPGSSRGFLDINLGIGWTKKFNKITPTLAYSINHLNKPNQSLNSAKSKTPFKHSIFTEIDFQIKKGLNIKPRINYTNTVSAQNFIALLNVYKEMNENLTLFAGGGHRGALSQGGAAIGIIGAQYKKIEFGFSMDFTTSSLNEYSNKNSFEISLSYTTPSSAVSKIAIPCDRY